MNASSVNMLMKKALSDFRMAEREMNRPKEDIVTMSVCINIRSVMSEMMRAYCTSQGVKYREGSSLNEMLSYCLAMDKQFGKINFGNIPCSSCTQKECEDKHCLSTIKVNECFEETNKLKNLLFKKMNIRENE